MNNQNIYHQSLPVNFTRETLFIDMYLDEFHDFDRIRNHYEQTMGKPLPANLETLGDLVRYCTARCGYDILDAMLKILAECNLKHESLISLLRVLVIETGYSELVSLQHMLHADATLHIFICKAEVNEDVTRLRELSRLLLEYGLIYPLGKSIGEMLRIEERLHFLGKSSRILLHIYGCEDIRQLAYCLETLQYIQFRNKSEDDLLVYGLAAVRMGSLLRECQRYSASNRYIRQASKIAGMTSSQSVTPSFLWSVYRKLREAGKLQMLSISILDLWKPGFSFSFRSMLQLVWRHVRLSRVGMSVRSLFTHSKASVQELETQLVNSFAIRSNCVPLPPNVINIDAVSRNPS